MKGVTRAAAGLALVVVSLTLGATTAAADNCSGPADCERTGGYETIIAVVGGAGAVAAAAAAIIADVEEDGEEGEEPDTAIVQVSEGALTVEPDKPASLTLTGWHVGAEGTKRVSMPLSVEVPPDSGLVADPEDGTGELICEIRLEEDTGATEATITATGEWNGAEASATVTVTIISGYGLRLF